MRYLFLCLLFFTDAVAIAQKDVIEGNGKKETREFPVKAFTNLKVSGPFELQLIQGNREKLVVEADENLLQYFDISNEGDALVVKMKETKGKSWRVKDKMKVAITFRELSGIDLSTVGKVHGDGEMKFKELKMKNSSVGNIDLHLKADRFELNNSSVGNITLKGTAQEAEVKHSGVGSLHAGGFKVQVLDIENTGVGSADVNAEKKLIVKDSFLGKVRNHGDAPTRKSNRVRI